MPRSRRSRNSVIALTVTAAAASLGLYLWLRRRSTTTDTSDSLPTQSPRDVPLPPPPPPTTLETSPSPLTFTPNGRRVALVIDGRSDILACGLLESLRNSLSVTRVNVLILVLGPPSVAEQIRRRVFGIGEFVLRLESEGSLVPMLKQLAPEAVYIEEGMAGDDGVAVCGLLDGGWVGGVVVVGDGVEKAWWGGVRRYGKRCRILGADEVAQDWRDRVG